ncbi:ABC transporter substrate-binding protein [Pseudarthrobacter sp. NamB4]|uniref:ABC transporter substrate-binding protein n=1 Tax=Pseudarthrobacter sp. NamB4 TaxID=2576837 RepID=UPI0014853F25|nr:extracellular solute-binding protein [Pseudarthrobacter sp. NamB4]
MQTLRVWLKAGHTVEIIRRLLPEFRASTGIEVALELVPEGVAHDALVQGSALADVVTVPFWYLEELRAAGNLLPVATADVGLDERAFVPDALGALRRGGVLWAVPHTLTGGMLAYRQDAFDAAGLGRPQSLADVLTADAVLQERGMGLVARCNGEFSSLETFSGWAAAKSVRLLPDAGDPTFEDLRDGAGDLVQALSGGPRDLTALDYAGVGNLVSAGHASHLFDTSAWAFQFEEPGSPVRGLMGYTTVGDALPAQFVYAEGLGITAGCRSEEAARQFIAWRHSEEVLRAEVEGVRRIDIPRADLRERDWYRDFVAAAGLQDCLRAVDKSWSGIDFRHIPLRVDFVGAARRLMSAISGTVSGKYVSLAEAYDVTYQQDGRPR